MDEEVTFRHAEAEAKSPSKRWSTTATSALSEVAEKLAGNYDRSKQVRELTARKLHNTKTSINFGNEKINYISDAKENQLKCTGGNSVEERAAQSQRIKKMKADLTVTNFNLGDEVPEYESVNQSTLKPIDYSKHIRAVSQAPKVVTGDVNKLSSIHFGNEAVNYHSVAQDAMRYKGNENNFSQLKAEVKEMTATLRKHNFSFGDEKLSYQSDYQSGFGSVPIEAYKVSGNKKAGMKAIIEDSRSCHFSLGQDKIQYQSNTQGALSSIDGYNATDVKQSMERSKQMKIALQRTSIVIGDDAEYF